MLGTVAHPEGITNPPIDDLLEKVDSKYGLVIDAAKRARQINTYAQQLESNQLEVFGPALPCVKSQPTSLRLSPVTWLVSVALRLRLPAWLLKKTCSLTSLWVRLPPKPP